MLTKMILENFLSFRNKTVFDFTASKYTIMEDTNVYREDGQTFGTLKGALFIGPNASGKTNALSGIMFLLKTIKDNNPSFDIYKCVFQRKDIFRASYEFIFLNRLIVYSIAYSRNQKELEEKLTVDNETVLYRKGSYGELRYGPETISDSQLDAGTTFLRSASFNTGRFPQRPELRALMDFLLNSNYITGDNLEALFGNAITKYAEGHGVEKVNEYLDKFQYDFIAEYDTKSQGAGYQVDFGDRKNVFMKRRDFMIPVPIQIEAQGNKVFLNLLPYLIAVIEKPGILVVDEFGNSLHNILAEKIVRFFMGHAKGSQIFITSHCTNLISNSVFRPDQIDLITFRGESGSCVERISKYKPREAQNLEKMYLGGMFEGLPNYGEKI